MELDIKGLCSLLAPWDITLPLAALLRAFYRKGPLGQSSPLLPTRAFALWAWPSESSSTVFRMGMKQLRISLAAQLFPHCRTSLLNLCFSGQIAMWRFITADLGFFCLLLHLRLSSSSTLLRPQLCQLVHLTAWDSLPQHIGAWVFQKHPENCLFVTKMLGSCSVISLPHINHLLAMAT